MTIAATCPICGRPADAKTRPFCTRRCADVDLGRWFSGQYAIPALPADPEEEEQIHKLVAERVDPGSGIG